MRKTPQIPVVFEGKAKKEKNTLKITAFLASWLQKIVVFTKFLERQENAEGTKHCK